MLSDKLKELAAAKANLAQLEEAVASERQSELRELPARYGFDSADAFIAAVKSAAGGGRGRRPRGSAAKPTAGKRRKRARITDDTRAEVKKLVGEGKTGNEIAKAVGISLPSVQNIKKALGLVRKGRK